MAMTDGVLLGLAAGAGLLVGAMFFGGLWWTVRRGLSSPRPALWFLASLLVRTALATTGIYLASGGQWQRLFACMVGFGLARVLATRLLGPPLPQAPERAQAPETAQAPERAKEAAHAP